MQKTILDITFKSDSDVELIDFMGGDDRTATSAWVSFGNDVDERLEDQAKVKGLIKFLYRNQHMTPFESSIFTFRIKTPIFVCREFFRHRSASYNEYSMRYSEFEPVFYMPSPDRPLKQAGKPGDYYFVPGDNEQYAIVKTNLEAVYKQAWLAYQNILEAGVAKEVARDALPVSAYSYFYVTMNARNLMHFLGLRNDSHALYEIREVAVKMEEIFAEKMPYTYEAYKGTQEPEQKTFATGGRVGPASDVVYNINVSGNVTRNPRQIAHEIQEQLKSLNLQRGPVK